MGYLVCEKCNGYYELQKGESPDDFAVCECGGQLIYTEKMEDINPELKEASISTICPVCGTENPEMSQFCASCGNNLSEENEKTILNDKKVPTPTKPINNTNKVTFKNKTWYKKKFTILLVIIVILMISTVIYAINSSNNISPTTIETIQNVQSSNSSNSETNTQTQSSADDYDRGYDSGYFSGVNEAYSDWPYANSVSKSLKVSETWRQGYKAGYKQGYNDIKNGNSLKKPRTPGTAILDPRTNEKIYS